jgi:hypothetical protein
MCVPPQDQHAARECAEVTKAADGMIAALCTEQEFGTPMAAPLSGYPQSRIEVEVDFGSAGRGSAAIRCVIFGAPSTWKR